MEAIFAPLREHPLTKTMMNNVEQENLPMLLNGSFDTGRGMYMHLLGKNKKHRLILTYSEDRAREIIEDYRFFDKNVMMYPAKDILFYSADIHGNAIVRQRMEVLKHLLEGEPLTIVLVVDALMDQLPKKDAFLSNSILLNEADTIVIADFTKKLVELGYEKIDTVDGAGQFAVRGGIIDIYPLTEECPYRIELWGDEIDSIKSFDVESQRSIERIESLSIYPAVELVLTEERIQAGIKAVEKEFKKQSELLMKEMRSEANGRLKKEVRIFKEEIKEISSAMNLDSYIHYFYDEVYSFLDYFNEDTIVYVDEPEKVLLRAQSVEMEFTESMTARLEDGYILPGQADVIFTAEILLRKLLGHPIVMFQDFYKELPEWPEKCRYELPIRMLPSYHSHFEQLMKDIARWKKKEYRVLLFSPSTTRAKRLADNLQDNDILCFYSDDKNRMLKPREVMVTTGKLNGGFVFEDEKLIVITEGNIFKEQQNKRKKKLKKRFEGGEKIKGFDDLSVGDYIVHERHGIGIYRGIEKIEVDKVVKDYISVEYAGSGKLFILASQLDSIQKYADKDAKKPKINKLGGSEWNKTKAKVKSQVELVAKELVSLYAARQMSDGYAFSEDMDWQKEFEELFPYEETEDQLKAIKETKEDMESRKIMDRLICGDVGYGKTEIAIRAAFKAVVDGKQVAYLVPTTILCQQHYSLFTERMKDFPVKVRMLCRFQSQAEQKKIIKEINEKKVDIVIGTHRLLSKDIAYPDLGLLIIDEEQRFGVSHKEKIKQLRQNVDVLTLSATPIPRTLHMSLVGIRDMSLLSEPPVDRRAIQTYVMEYNKELVREAIKRELKRDGQVYYVYNRVNNIEQIASDLTELLPDARIAFAHGQMKERELEDIMYQFVNKEIDVLVATTIIETGLDIPNVNTMIIHDAENFGLSQLYQLRGRVGRSNRSAYAFLMYKRDKVLKEVAEKRLQAIREFTDLGSGFKIAMRDLEIRGAGNLLGKDQSGHMAAVGYDMYCAMLNEEVCRLKQIPVKERSFDTVVDLPIDAYIPATYVKNEFVKLDLYKRIAQVKDLEGYEDMLDEVTDRFGEPPQAVINLLKISLLKELAHQANITEVTLRSNKLSATMYAQANVNSDKIDPLLKSYHGYLRLILNPMEPPKFIEDLSEVDAKDFMEHVERLIQNINGLLEDAKVE